MPGFTVQRSGFVRAPELFYQLVVDLLAHGFTQSFPTTPLLPPVANQVYAPFKVTLEAGPTIDQFNANMPWRIQIDAFSAQDADITVATPLQLQNDGSKAMLDKTESGGGSTLMPAGHLSTTSPLSAVSTTNPTMLDQHFLFRSGRVLVEGNAEAYPMSYRLTTTSHGIGFFLWEDASDAYSNHFSWFVVQRPVDHITGLPTTTGHRPLFCIFGLNTKVSQFVVREDDILKPGKIHNAALDEEDSAAIINITKQVSITENNRYVITFPNGLNTQRYMYTEELDLLAYTSADVISQFSDVPLTVYGEATPRTYKALNANDVNNSGMRILTLVAGGPMI